MIYGIQLTLIAVVSLLILSAIVFWPIPEADPYDEDVGE